MSQKLEKTKAFAEMQNSENLKRYSKVVETSHKIKDTYQNILNVITSQGQVIDRIDYNLYRGAFYME